jgi:UPF0716 protein FxsA
MVSRLFVLYLVVEFAVVVALAWAIGLGWTLLLLLAAFLVGTTVAGSQLKRRARVPGDGPLIALGTLLVVVPGLVTTAAGLLLLSPPTRAAARPMLTALAARVIGRRATLITVGGRRYASTPDYIDGEVIDVTEVDPPAVPDEGR